MVARLIVVEGADKVGKETQSKMLAHSLSRYGDRVKLTEVPFNDHITYRTIYWMLRNGQAKKLPNAFQTLQFLNKLFFQFTLLAWYMLTNDYVVLDRWKLSSIVYGDATGANGALNRFLNWFLFNPDITVVIHGRSYKRGSSVDDDSYEKDSDLQLTVKEAYKEYVTQHVSDHALIDNRAEKDEVARRIRHAVMDSQ